MPQSDSRTTLAQREMQHAIELLIEINWVRHELLQRQGEMSALRGKAEAAHLRNLIDVMPAGSDCRADAVLVWNACYERECFAVCGDEAPDFHALEQASFSRAIEAAKALPALSAELERMRSEFVGQCNALHAIAPKIRFSVRAHRQMFTDAELKTVIHALEFVRMLRVNPWVLPSNEGWAGSAIQTLQQLSELLPESEVVVTTKTAVKPKVSSKDIAGRLLISAQNKCLYSSIQILANSHKCSSRTIRRAINSNKILQVWAKRYSRSIRTTTLTNIVNDKHMKGEFDKEAHASKDFAGEDLLASLTREQQRDMRSQR